MKNDPDIEVYCRRCGGLLHGSRSKEIGFGPNCYRIWKKERMQRSMLFGGDNDEVKQK